MPSSNGEITWTNGTRKLSDLIPWEHNPRQLTERQLADLQTSILKFGIVQPFVISPHDAIYDGHQRKNAIGLLRELGADIPVPVRISSRDLTEPEQKELTIRLHENTGEWDFDGLANLFEVDELKEWGFPESKLNAMGLVLERVPYSRKVESPIYTPKGLKPKPVDLYNDQRTSELIVEIEAVDLPEDEKAFLRIAAQRHTVLDFEKIAEFYAHSDANTQALMENSALVIIDFNRAIELGFVKLSEKIAEQFAEDYGIG